jgi:zinc D-Ala-D-Ala carboxypeptidase
VSRHFTEKELSCQCWCGFKITDKNFLAMVDKIRDKVGEPLVLNSAARCKKHNAAIGGAKNSAHVLGLAVDIKCTDSHLRYKIVSAAYAVGIKRIEWGTRSWVHIDAATPDTGHPQERLFLP